MYRQDKVRWAMGNGQWKTKQASANYRTRQKSKRNATRVVVKHTGTVFFYNMADGGGFDAVNDIIARSRNQVAVPQDGYVLLRKKISAWDLLTFGYSWFLAGSQKRTITSRWEVVLFQKILLGDFRICLLYHRP